MNKLDKAVELLAQRGAPPARTRALALLEGLVQDCNAAAKVWRDYQAAPGAPGDQWSLVSWVGAARAKQLHEINLSAKARAFELGRLAGPEAGRFIDLDDDVIEMAYRQLVPGETGSDAAKAAIERSQAKANHLRELSERLKTARPAKAAKPAAKTGGAKKTAAAKKALKKKSAPKKAVKKVPKKKAPKKK